MFGLGSSELIIIAIIIFLLFGAKRLPEVGRGLGQAIKEFRKVKKEVSEESPRLTEENVSKGSQSKEGEIKAGQ
ncbi:MAG: twin-arginine translocase TatA/TatE family subunit [Desulfatiglandales bacterium]